MKLRILLTMILLSTHAYAESWQCKNDMEIRCANGKCSTPAKDGFTPMSISFNDSGSISVCAYSGCWEGRGVVNKTKSFLSVTGHNLRFSTSPNNVRMREDILIALDRRDNIATLKVGGFAHPLICTAAKPKFDDYKTSVYSGRTKPIIFRGNPDARMFRTRLRQARKAKVNFAGRYIFTTWGCGTSCVVGALIDARTGRVYFPKEFGGIGFSFGDAVVPDEPWEYQKDSRLFVLNGTPPNSKQGPGTTYLVWQGTRFRQVAFVKAKSRK